RAEVMQKLLEAHQFEVPQTLVDQQASHKLESIVRDMIGRGIDPRNREVDWEGAREELKVQAETDVRATLLMDRIAEAENLSVSDEEVEAEIQLVSEMSKQPIEQMRAA